MVLANEMAQLTKEYEDKFFDPEVFKYIIRLIRIAAQQGKYRLILRVRGPRNMYSSLIRHLRSEGFTVSFLYGGVYNGEITPNSLCIDW